MYHHFINYHYRYNLNNFYWKSADFHDIMVSRLPERKDEMYNIFSTVTVVMPFHHFERR
jgi:hypothetical protein